jgi:hypothetical protein
MPAGRAVEGRWDVVDEPQAPVLPDGVVSEWRPTRRTFVAWTVLMVPIFVVGLDVYVLAALHGQTHAEGSANLAQTALVVALSVALMCVHEGVHGIVILAFGARPEFGILRNASFPVGFYATAPGRRFSRNQYLLVCLAPLAVLAPLGILACWLPFGGYLVIPFALHLAGCIGDVTISWHVLRSPSSVICEDMSDGTRFWKAEA